VDELAGAGLVEVAGGQMSLTRHGRLMASEVTIRLISGSLRPGHNVAAPASAPAEEVALGRLDC
jgi:hypothetical protein